MFIFIHSYLPSSVLLDLGLIKIYWYGLLMALAVGICLHLAIKNVKSQGLDKEIFFNLFFYLVVFGLIGARLWHAVFYNFDYFIANPLAIFKVWQGGLAIQGAILAGLLTAFFYGRKHLISFWLAFDITTAVLPLGQAIGRWGNYFNQELFGPPCNFSWCIPIDLVNRPDSFVYFTHFHPVFLYESILSFFLFALIWFVLRNKNIITGGIGLFYLGGYAIIRFLTEFWRLDSAVWLFGLTWVQWLCLAVVLTAIIWYLKLGKQKRRLSGGTDGTRT